MSNPNYATDILATTIENRSGKLQDLVSKNNAILSRLKSKGKIRPFSGGRVILEELMYAENANGGWYSGYDPLPVGAGDTMTAAEYAIRQYAVPIVMSGLEMLQNAGKEQIIDMMSGRLKVAEATMKNGISQGLYHDGTVNAKMIDGLGTLCAIGTTTGRVTSSGTAGNINRTSGAWWQPYWYDVGGAITNSNIQTAMNQTWAQLVRGADRPDLIMMDTVAWTAYLQVLQPLQRFSSSDMAEAGFMNLKFMDADVVLDGGIGGYAGDPGTGTIRANGNVYFLNTDYLHFRPHSKRNMVPLAPNKRYAINQDAEVQILAWAGNLTCSGLMFQGRIGE